MKRPQLQLVNLMGNWKAKLKIVFPLFHQISLNLLPNFAPEMTRNYLRISFLIVSEISGKMEQIKESSESIGMIKNGKFGSEGNWYTLLKQKGLFLSLWKIFKMKIIMKFISNFEQKYLIFEKKYPNFWTKIMHISS